MIIKRGIFQEHVTIVDMISSNITTSFSSILLQTSAVPAVAMEFAFNSTSAAATHSDINIKPNNFKSGIPFSCLTNCLSYVVEFMASVVLDEEYIVNDGPIFDEEPSNDNISTPTMCLTECPSFIVNITVTAMAYTIAEEVVVVPVHASTPLTPNDISTTCISIVVADKPGITLDIDFGLATIVSMLWLYFSMGDMATELGITMPSHEHLVHDNGVQAYACSQGTDINFSNLGILPYDVEVHSVVPMKSIEWKSWPPPIVSKIKCGCVETRPMPWPSFNIAAEVIVWCYFGLLKKPPWLLPLLAEILGAAGPDQWSIEPRKGVMVMFVP